MDALQNTKYGKSYYTEILNKEDKDTAGRIWEDANNRYRMLVEENRQLSEKIKAHTEKFIFPAIAAYQALLAEDPECAMEIMEKAESRVSMKTGLSYQRIVRIPFMRKVFLKIFSSGSKDGFAEESGFINICVHDSKEDIAFDIEKCPYHDYCVKHGCPELTHIFCNNDINAYGNLPGIIFERHETLGNGGKKCDFHLYLKEK